MFSEFKKFIAQGNVLDLAVGVIIGAAFGKIVASFVDDIIMPIIGALLQGVDFKKLELVVGDAHIKYGNFIQTVVDFLVIAYVIFLVVKSANKMRLSEKKTDEKA
jgi:large conductance mechanosensitive channel